MARTAEGAALTAQHRQAQIGLRARALRDFTLLWPLWRGDRASFEALVTATLPLVRAHHRFSASLAGAYYAAFRQAEIIPGRPAPRLAPALEEGRILTSLYVTGEVAVGAAIRAGHSPAAAMQTGLTRTSGAVTRLVLDGGRETIRLSTAADDRALGWARVTAGKPCAFCAMLASRGPVYKDDSADFQAHDHCSCAAEPHYEGAEWPGRAREFRETYNKAAREARASGDSDTLNAFRRALEGTA